YFRWENRSQIDPRFFAPLRMTFSGSLVKVGRLFYRLYCKPPICSPQYSCEQSAVAFRIIGYERLLRTSPGKNRGAWQWAWRTIIGGSRKARQRNCDDRRAQHCGNYGGG